VSSLLVRICSIFSEGWLYVFDVGVAGGTVLRQRDPAPSAGLADVSKAIEA
jgi:hypothetical protein